MALAYRNLDVRIWLQKHKRHVSLSFYVGLASIPFFIACFRMAPADTMYYWGHSYLAIFYMVSLLNILLNQGSPNLAFLRSKVLQFYGKISYSTYLFHPTIIGLFFLSKGRTESLSTIGDTTLLAGAFAVTTAFCWSSYLLLEEPLIAWGHRIRYSPAFSGSKEDLTASSAP